jgi:hypothetical protein
MFNDIYKIHVQKVIKLHIEKMSILMDLSYG